MTAEELNNQFSAVLSENVGEVTNNVNANALPKAAGAFLMSNNRYSHTVNWKYGRYISHFLCRIF